MQNRRLTYFLYGYGALIFVFLIFRCLWVPPYPDEILNYHVYANPGEFIPFMSYPDANNHFISTFFNWISYHLFGSNVIWMRFFELASFALFYRYLLKFRQFFTQELVSTCMVVGLSSGFFMLTFFTLARGYGMSMAFFVGALFYLFKAYQAVNLKSITSALVFSSLTLWSNLSMTLSVLLILILLAFRIYKIRNQSTMRLPFHLANITFGILPIVLAIVYGFYLKSTGAFWLGGNTGFIQDVIINLSYRTLGEKGIWLFITIITVLSLFTIYNIRKINLSNNLILASCLFFGTIIGTVGLHLILGVNYPHNRAALHIVILFLLFSFVLFDQAQNWTKYAAIVPTGILLIHHLINLNFIYPSGWKDSTLDEGLYDTLVEKQKDSDQLITINAPFYFQEVVHYYNYRNPSRLNNVQWTGYPNKIADFIIANPIDKVANINEFDTVYFHPETKVTLLERKVKLDWQDLQSKQLANRVSADSSIALGSFQIDLATDQNMLASIDMDLKCQEKVDFASLNLIFYDENGAQVYNEGIVLNQYRSSFNQEQVLEKSAYFKVKKGKYNVEFLIENPRFYKWEISAAKIALQNSLFP